MEIAEHLKMYLFSDGYNGDIAITVVPEVLTFAQTAFSSPRLYDRDEEKKFAKAATKAVRQKVGFIQSIFWSVVIRIIVWSITKWWFGTGSINYRLADK